MERSSESRAFKGERRAAAAAAAVGGAQEGAFQALLEPFQAQEAVERDDFEAAIQIRSEIKAVSRRLEAWSLGFGCSSGLGGGARGRCKTFWKGLAAAAALSRP